VDERIRVAMGLSYNGQAYAGWQSQPNGNTVQDRLEAALAQFCDQSVSTLCAGRTDAGVHGVMQVVHFDTELRRTPYSWTRGTNSFLPPDIAVQWAQEVPTGFHSRGSAVCRRYAYVLLESAIRPSLEQGRVGWVFRPLDQAAMEQAAAYLLGEHDFTSFRATGCQALSPVKNIRAIRISRKSSRPESAYWRFEFEANAFLHHMIRNIMGCLIWVGQGLQPASWMAEVLAAKDRDAAAPTFSPDGLYFLGPQYEAHWGLPPCAPAYDWLP
jgi:tRNA pseudouridine38-40 synthase